jgi:hypothetical protein
MSLTTRIRIKGLLNPLALVEAIAKILKYPNGVQSMLYVPTWDKNLRIEYPAGVGALAHLYMAIPDQSKFIYDYSDQSDEPLYRKCNLSIALTSSSDDEEKQHHKIVNAIAPLLATVQWYASNGYYPVRNSLTEWVYKTSPYAKG